MHCLPTVMKKMKTLKNKLSGFLDNHKLIRQMLRFSIIGISAFFIDTALFWLFIKCGINQNVALALAFIITLIYNYIFSIEWVFDSKKKNSSSTLFVFSVLSAIGLLLTELIYSLIIHGVIDYCLQIAPTDVWKLFAKVVSSFIVMVYNFITRKFFLEKTLKKSSDN